MAEHETVMDSILYLGNASNTSYMKNVLLSALILLVTPVLGQEVFRSNHDFGLNLSHFNRESLIALSWKQVHDISKNKKFQLGYGIRYNGYSSNNQNYITAPAELTSDEKGPQVFFIENIEENLDTLSVAKARHHSINAVIYIEYDITDKIGVGFNIDAAGIAFGPSVSGTMNSSLRDPNTSAKEKASPTAYNVLLVSDNAIGMLNRELYGTYNFNKNLSVNLGLSFLFTEYTTENEIVYNFDNDRFRRKSLLGMIGINYKPFK